MQVWDVKQDYSELSLAWSKGQHDMTPTGLLLRSNVNIRMERDDNGKKERFIMNCIEFTTVAGCKIQCEYCPQKKISA